MSAEDEVRKASQQFYSALNSMLNGDTGPMAAIWSHGPTVTTMHPLGGREVGWDRVRQTWDQVSKMVSDGEVKLSQPLISAGTDMAYEAGTETGHAMFNGQEVTFDHRVTNVYRREAGQWKIVHHHTDTSSAMLDLVGG